MYYKPELLQLKVDLGRSLAELTFIMMKNEKTHNSPSKGWRARKAGGLISCLNTRGY